MTDHRASRLLTKMEIPLLLAVPAVMTAALLAGIEQAALAMLVVVALVLALFFAGYEASRPGLRQIVPTLVLAALAAAGRILFGPIPDFKPVSAIAIIAGATLGRRNGFMVGALAALTVISFLDRACGRRGRCMPGVWWAISVAHWRMRARLTVPMEPCECRRCWRMALPRACCMAS